MAAATIRSMGRICFLALALAASGAQALDTVDFQVATEDAQLIRALKEQEIVENLVGALPYHAPEKENKGCGVISGDEVLVHRPVNTLDPENQLEDSVDADSFGSVDSNDGVGLDGEGITSVAVPVRLLRAAVAALRVAHAAPSGSAHSGSGSVAYP